MSPVKTSRSNEELKYVDGHLSDGKEVCRFVSFNVKIKDEIEKIKIKWTRKCDFTEL